MKTNKTELTSVTPKMLFDVMFSNGIGAVIDVKFGCGEDFERFYNYYKTNKWNDLFYEQGFDRFDIDEVNFAGITVDSKDNFGNSAYIDIAQSRPVANGYIKINPTLLESESVQKLNNIKEMLASGTV